MPHHRTRSLLALGAAMLVAFASARSAAAQDAFGLLKGDSLDWTAIDRAHAQPTAAALQGLGICPFQAQHGAAYFHYLDVDADGRLDLVYSGATVYCNEEAEGALTLVFLNRGARLQRTLQTEGQIVALRRSSPWEPYTLVLREDGCCGDYLRTLRTLVPRLTREGWKYEETTAVSATFQTVYPRALLPEPRAFTVAQDAYNLRIAPVVDDTSEGTFMVDNRHGNVMARYPRGSRGTALAEQTDATGRVWWFVVMQSPAADQKWAPGSAPEWNVGWMSSRFATPDAPLPAGRADPEPPPGQGS